MRNTLLLLLMLLVFSATALADAAKEAYDRGDYKTAFRLYEPRAKTGEAEAQIFIGWMYHYGKGVSQDYKQAVSWYRKAAEQGDSYAQYNLGLMYFNGMGVSQDFKQAVTWFHKSAEQGTAPAQNSLGIMYENGQGVSQDYKQAVSWYRKAAEQGDDRAQTNLGWMYYSGQGVTQDYKQAVTWYRKAAEQGYKTGIIFLQNGLNTLGYDPGPADGVYGTKTYAAVEQFFRDNDVAKVGKSARTKDTTPPRIYKRTEFEKLFDLKIAKDKKVKKSTVIKDTTPPKIHIMQRDITFLSDAKKTIRGQAVDASGVAIVTVNQEEAALDGKGNFSLTVYLKPGKNRVVITAIDIHKNQASKTIIVERKDRGAKPNPLADAIRTGNYYALLIAVQDYQHRDINDLDHPVNDAKKVKKVLQKYSFKNKNITVLKNPNRDEIINTFGELRRKITRQDNLLIFYAGHGHWDEDIEQGYWLPSDASKNSTSRWLSNSTIRDYIRGIQTKHTLLVSDACFSGGIFKTRKAFSDASVATNELYKLPSRKAMTSGVLKVVPDKSVFIQYFLKRLRDNNKKYLPSEQLFVNFKTAVINNSPLQQVPQYGEIREAGDEGGDFIFVRSDN